MTLWQHVFYHPAARILDCSSIERPFRGHHNLYHDALVNMNIERTFIQLRILFLGCVVPRVFTSGGLYRGITLESA